MDLEFEYPRLETKEGMPASILKWSNSTPLKSGLYISSQVAENSSVVRVPDMAKPLITSL